MPTVHKRASAKRDLVQIYVYLAEHAGLETAEEFLRSAERTFRDLSAHPGMGVALHLRGRALYGLRKWRVRRFEKILICLRGATQQCFDCTRFTRSAGRNGGNVRLNKRRPTAPMKTRALRAEF